MRTPDDARDAAAGIRAASGPAGTVIGRGALVRGEITCAGAVEVRGCVEGDCCVDGPFTVTEGGRVLGNIDATVLVIEGEVVAGLLTADKIDIRRTGRVTASLRGRAISIADGAFFEGAIEGRVEPPKPNQEG